MSAIPREHRIVISEAEFLEACAKYNIAIRKAGVKYWFYDLDHLDRTPSGETVSPAELTNFVYREFLDRKGEPVLQIVANVGSPSRLGLAYTRAGRRWRAEQLAWARAIGRAPRRRARRTRKGRKVERVHTA